MATSSQDPVRAVKSFLRRSKSDGSTARDSARLASSLRELLDRLAKARCTEARIGVSQDVELVLLRTDLR